jgi:endo-1,4-beta-xylanase
LLAGLLLAGCAGGKGHASVSANPGCSVPARFKWSSSGVVLGPVSDPMHALVSIKDPSIVYFSGKWHVFVTTASATGGYSMAYLTFADWDHTASATFNYLDENPELGGYHAAPQVFYFTPQNKWYLIYQSGHPQYSTNRDLGNPGGWSRPTSFFAAEPAIIRQNGGWLDFWVICDSAHCHLFFSDDRGRWYRSQTAVTTFPDGFSDPAVVMQDPNGGRLFEASNVYKMKGTGKYLALIEAFDASSNFHRYFRSWTADRLDGAWTPLQDTFTAPFAATSNITFAGAPWTSDISHGEMIRDGYDESLTIDTCHMQYLYQGLAPSAVGGPYGTLPWRLGLLTKAPDCLRAPASRP